MAEPVTVEVAATALGVSTRQVQADVKKGCAGIALLGSVGRGKGTLLDLAAYRAWRSQRAGATEIDVQRECERIFLLSCATALRTFKEDAAGGPKAKARSAALLCRYLNRLAPVLLGCEIEEPPPEMRTLLRIYAECTRR